MEGKPPPRYTWRVAIFQGVCWAGAWYLVGSPSSVGVSVALLGLAAVVMAVRADVFSRTEKIMWILLASALCFAEIESIRSDQRQRASEQQEAIEEENDRFEQVLKQNQRSFEASLSTMASIGSTAARNLRETTGGKSFCYDWMFVQDSGLAHQLLSAHGLYDVQSCHGYVAQVDPFVLGQSFLGPVNFQRGASVILPDIQLDVASQKRGYNVFITARNGIFTEFIRIRRVDATPSTQSRWKTAIRVTALYYDAPRTEYVVLDQSDRGFPLESLGDDKDWNRAGHLPKLDVIRVDQK
jgi:hypothetical protein